MQNPNLWNSSFGGKILSKWNYVDRSRSALFHSRDKLPILWLLYFEKLASFVFLRVNPKYANMKTT